MAPPQKKPNPGLMKKKKKSRWINLPSFGFGSKQTKKPCFSKDAPLQHWGTLLQHHPCFLINQPHLDMKKDLSGKCMKQFEQQPRFDKCSYDHIDELNSFSKPTSQKKSAANKEAKRRHSRTRFEWDAIAAMLVLMVILTILLVCGRLCAILCASIWFYCTPHLMKTSKPRASFKLESSNDAKDENSELDSDAYRKKVVMQGLLERNNKIYTRGA